MFMMFLVKRFKIDTENGYDKNDDSFSGYRCEGINHQVIFAVMI